MPSADQAGTSWIHIILVNSYLRYININQNMYETMFPTYLAQIQKVATLPSNPHIIVRSRSSVSPCTTP
jgi:hypothetical protein